MSDTPHIGSREAFARFLKDPSRDKLREVIRDRTGEYDFLDFKQAWPEWTDLAKHILAFANSGSGCIVVGVAQADDGTLITDGVASIIDKTVIKNSVKKFVPPSVEFDIHDFSYNESEYDGLKGKSFQVLLVVCNPTVTPVLSLAESKGLYRNRIYIRTNSSSDEADHWAVQKLIERRLKAERPTARLKNLAAHLEDLEKLHRASLPDFAWNCIEDGDPMDDYFRFIEEMIGLKQRLIRGFIEDPKDEQTDEIVAEYDEDPDV